MRRMEKILKNTGILRADKLQTDVYNEKWHVFLYLLDFGDLYGMVGRTRNKAIKKLYRLLKKKLWRIIKQEDTPRKKF